MKPALIKASRVKGFSRNAQSSPSTPLPLMITDVMIPGLNGPVLAERIAEARPETRVPKGIGEYVA